MKWEKAKNNILICSIIFLGIFILLHFLLKVIEIRFRQWVYYFVGLLAVIGIVVGIVQCLRNKNNIVNKNKVVKALFVSCIIGIMLLGVIFWRLIILVLAFSYYPEHTIVKDGNKYIASVRSFLSVNVDYYTYINFFLMGDKVKMTEYYGKGGYDPFDSKYSESKPLNTYYYNDKGNKTQTIVKKDDEITNDNESNILSNSTQIDTSNSNNYDEVLYERQFDKNTIIRIVHRDYILAQRELISVEKTEDGGKTWNMQTEETDGVIQIHSGAKFTFITDKVGFINDPGLVGTSGDNRGLLVTIDGGKTFTNAAIKVNSSYIYLDDVPYVENDILKIKAHITKAGQKEYIYLYSNDDGITWKQEK